MSFSLINMRMVYGWIYLAYLVSRNKESIWKFVNLTRDLTPLNTLNIDQGYIFWPIFVSGSTDHKRTLIRTNTFSQMIRVRALRATLMRVFFWSVELFLPLTIAQFFLQVKRELCITFWSTLVWNFSKLHFALQKKYTSHLKIENIRSTLVLIASIEI